MTVNSYKKKKLPELFQFIAKNDHRHNLLIQQGCEAAGLKHVIELWCEATTAGEQCGVQAPLCSTADPGGLQGTGAKTMRGWCSS